MSCLHPIIVRGPEVGSFGLLGVCVVLMWLPGDPRRGLLVAPRESRHLARRFRPSTVVGLCISTYLVSLVVDVSFPRRLSCLLLASLVS